MVAMAIAAGSIILSHVNDGGFWIISKFFNLTVPEHQQIAADVLDYVYSMWNASDALATRCRDDAKELLASLNSAVEEIFQDLEEAHEEATATERAAGGGAFLERDEATYGLRQGSPSGRHGEEGAESVKAAGNQAATPDVEAHRLWP